VAIFERSLDAGDQTARGREFLRVEIADGQIAYRLALRDLAGLLPTGILPAEGLFSINGMLTTNGDSLEKQLYNLYLKSSLIVKNTKLNRTRRRRNSRINYFSLSSSRSFAVHSLFGKFRFRYLAISS